MAAKTIFIAAGGTGGHLFPAVYIANALKKIQPVLSLIGIGAGRPLEQKIYSAHNVVYEIIPTVGIKDRGVRGMVTFFATLPKALYKTLSLIYRERPLAIVGVGGYVTVLPIVCGWLLKIPTLIHEAEGKPGLANFFLSFFSNQVTTAFEECSLPAFSNKDYTGHPVREGLIAAQRQGLLMEPPKNILIIGGSQGAQSLDDALPACATLIKEQRLQIWHQCRPQNLEEVTKRYRDQGIDAKVVSFIDDIIQAYTWADLIISRSGAGSVSELSVINKPTIFVPFPFAQADHQTKNARTLVSIGKAVLCPEGADFQTRLLAELKNMLEISRYNEMVSRSHKINNQHAAKTIASRVLRLIVAD